ncbi:MAG: hypothetical protein Q9207_002700 [Kuettlingeria erythrocarpa]
MARAASTLLDTCVNGVKHQGGRIDNLGQLRRLSIAVFSYASHTRCAKPGYGPHAPPVEACDAIIDQMPADKREQIVGPSDEKPDIEVPQAYTDPTRGCEMVIRSEIGKEIPERTSWYEIWAAAVAVRNQCVLQGRSGQAMVYGKSFEAEDACLSPSKQITAGTAAEIWAYIWDTLGTEGNLMVQMLGGRKPPVTQQRDLITDS